jgi:hypothetical protein
VPFATTQRFAEPTSVPGKIVWTFTRDLIASDPAVISALGPDQELLSDHDAVAVTVHADDTKR